MRILFVTSNRLGDAVLSTGLLDHLIRTHPDARITVACGPVAEGVFARMPNRERTIVLDKLPLPPALAAAVGQHGRHAVGPRGGHPRIDDRLDGADASPRGDATAARPQDRAACRGTRPRSAAAAGRLDRTRGPRPRRGAAARGAAGHRARSHRELAAKGLARRALCRAVPRAGARSVARRRAGRVRRSRRGGTRDGGAAAGRPARRDRSGGPAQPAGGRPPASPAARCSSATIPA